MDYGVHWGTGRRTKLFKKEWGVLTMHDRSRKICVVSVVLAFFMAVLPGLLPGSPWVPAAAANILADHTAVTQFDSIPDTLFQDIRDNYSFFYGHTSHGSQIMTGISMLENQDETLYDRPPFHEISSDLGHTGSLVWESQTRDWLEDHPETNVVMWSWCGGCSDNTDEGIDIYLEAMNQLELDYPDVTFIYMTGHLDGTGVDGTLYRNNNRIRDYCTAHGKILFDFADIESWDPDGNYYPDETDACGWCSAWCSEHECPSCGSCAHSHCFNCYRKGMGFWWMMARVAGWEPTAATTTSLGTMKSYFR